MAVGRGMASKTGYGASCAWRPCDARCVGGMQRTSTHAPAPLPSTSGSACLDAPLLVLRAPASRLEELPCVDSTKWSPYAIAVRSDLCYLLRTDTSSDVGTRFPPRNRREKPDVDWAGRWSEHHPRRSQGAEDVLAGPRSRLPLGSPGDPVSSRRWVAFFDSIDTLLPYSERMQWRKGRTRSDTVITCGYVCCI
jgi:hypothetical protein